MFTSDNNSNSPDNDDATLEILMSNMDNKAMVEFTKMKNDSSVEVIKVGTVMKDSKNSLHPWLRENQIWIFFKFQIVLSFHRQYFLWGITSSEELLISQDTLS